jgi:hypothetical protein
LASMTVTSAVAAADPPAADDSMSSMTQRLASVSDWARGAQLFDGLGASHRKISTPSVEAQAYFDQGMRLMWAFNHDESARSFARAAELDPDCAMCLWGFALTIGPNYNMPPRPRRHVLSGAERPGEMTTLQPNRAQGAHDDAPIACRSRRERTECARGLSRER